MIIDCSEVKSFKDCTRKWALTSRNQWHTTPRARKNVFGFGTAMHEMLHALYLGGDMQRCLDKALKGLDETEQKVITAIALGYSSGPLIEDLDKYEVLDIEYRFEFPAPGLEAANVTITGSIDMVVREIATNTIYGFEHKSCKAFRSDAYTLVDEQPRLYYYALKRLVEKMNKEDGAETYKFGGVFLNEVKKVQKKFEYKRTLCRYSDRDLGHFLASFLRNCYSICSKPESSALPPPEPSMMKCQMCEFVSVCTHYGYESPTLDEFLDEFGEEFKIRECDHLDEDSKKSPSEDSEEASSKCRKLSKFV